MAKIPNAYFNKIIGEISNALTDKGTLSKLITSESALFVNEENETLLHAVIRTDPEGRLASREARPSDTPLNLTHGDLTENAVRLLIEQGADINAQTNKQTLGTTLGDTPLHSAVKSNNIKAILILLENGADANITNHDGKTPLQVAIEGQHKAAMQLLFISQGTILSANDLNITTEQFVKDNLNNPLFLALASSLEADLKNLEESLGNQLNEQLEKNKKKFGDNLTSLLKGEEPSFTDVNIFFQQLHSFINMDDSIIKEIYNTHQQNLCQVSVDALNLVTSRLKDKHPELTTIPTKLDFQALVETDLVEHEENKEHATEDHAGSAATWQSPDVTIDPSAQKDIRAVGAPAAEPQGQAIG
jgi:hypothetical protein